jgi:RNA polymerase sigma-70 factor, ECF subfamily
MSSVMERSERFEAIYRRHVDAVYAYARRRAPADVAEEVVAETFLVCWRRLDRVPDYALPWLYGVARKALANQRRALRRRQAAERSLSPDEAAATAPDLRLRDALSRLAARDREVLALVAWEGLTLAEAAVALGCSHVACRVRFHRARRRLARLLEADGGPLPRPRTEGAAR